MSRRTSQSQDRQDLRAILQLNADLARQTEVADLLDAAVSGICQALELVDVTVYGFQRGDPRWRPLTTTAVDIPLDQPAAPETVTLLDAVYDSEDGRWEPLPGSDDGARRQFATLLRVGRKVLGALVVRADPADPAVDELPILVTTFALNLAALWQNLKLFHETRQRARELEILHGRYVDNLWYAESAAISADIDDGQVHINRGAAAKASGRPAGSGARIPLIISDHPLGAVTLPPDVHLDDEEADFVQAIIREMGNALNNAHLLQATRAYSNQLQVAAEVARAASTILDRDRLIQEVVELIRNRFDFYYVGLFLVDEEAQDVVLQAGSGKAGQTLVQRGFRLPIGGESMVGQVAANGRPLVAGDVRASRVFHRNPLLPDTRSELALPLHSAERLSGDRLIGVLTMQSSVGHTFSEGDIGIFQTLADQLTTAIQNASLFDQLQNSLSETGRLYRASRQIAKAADETAVYQTLVEFAAQSGLVDLAHIIAPDPDSPDHVIFPVLWSRQGTTADPDRDRFHRDRYPIVHLLQQNELIIIPDGQTDDRLGPASRSLFKRNAVRAAALVPIHVEDAWLATLVLDRRAADPMTAAEIQPFITLADQAATILANQQLLSRTDALYRLSRALHHALTREDAIQTVIDEIVRQSGVRRCHFVLYDPAAGAGQVAAAYGEGPLPDGRLGMDESSLYGLLVEQSGPLVIIDPPDDPRAGEYLRLLDTPTALIVPATSQQEVSGFIALDSFHRQRPPGRASINFIQSAVDQLAITLESLKLFDDTMRSAQELVILNQIGSRISGTLDLQELARTVYQEVGRLLDSTVFILALYDDETGEYQPLLSMNDGVVYQDEARHLQPDDPLRDFLHKGRPLLAHQPERLVTVAGSRPVADSDELPQACLWMPMQREGRPIGLISVQSYNRQAYDDNAIQLLRSIATQTGLAVSNAQLFSQTQANVVKLKEMDRLKTQFLANMSHELRTPLNSIIGFSRIMLKRIDGPISPAQEEDLQSIHGSGQHLLELINEILDMAKIEAGRMTLSFEPVNIVDLAADLLNVCRGLVQNDDVRLVWRVEPDLPPVEAEPTRLRQILLNLLSNAAKFTERGEIRLNVSRQESDLLVTVADTGVGIDPADHDKLFQAFQQVDASPTRTSGGTGLGLSITQRLVELHQGEIWFESEPGRGTTFHVRLPLEQKASGVTGRLPGTTQPERPLDLDRAINGRSQMSANRPFILIVDRAPDEISRIKRHLDQSPYMTLSAKNGGEGQAILQQFRSQIALMLLDADLPGADEVRAAGRATAVPVLLYGDDDSTPLQRPVAQEALLAAIATAVNAPTPTTEG